MGANLANRVAAKAGSAPDRSVAEIAGQQKPLTELVREMQGEFQKANASLDAGQLVRDVHTAISQNPKLRDCEPYSILGGAMTFAQLGLRVGVLGHGWLLPIRDNRAQVMKAQLILGYKGLVELVGRSQLITDLGVHGVYTKDVEQGRFRMGFDAGLRVFSHTPDWFADRGELLGWYGAAKTRGFDTYTVTEPWTVARMQAHRDAFAMAKKDGRVVGPWASNFEAMAAKTVLLDLMKLLPKSTEVARAIAADGGVRTDMSVAGIEQVEEVVDGEVVDDTHDPAPPAEPAKGEQQ